jgi:hypothetical protein
MRNVLIVLIFLALVSCKDKDSVTPNAAEINAKYVGKYLYKGTLVSIRGGNSFAPASEIIYLELNFGENKGVYFVEESNKVEQFDVEIFNQKSNSTNLLFVKKDKKDTFIYSITEENGNKKLYLTPAVFDIQENKYVTVACSICSLLEFEFIK